MKRWTKRNILWNTLLTILCIVCFPINPLVLTGVLVVKTYTVPFIIGWIVWSFGMVLVMAPIVMFPRRGGVSKGKPFVYTTRLVNTGIYSVVRHPQYLGGIMSIFLTTLLFYPHWLFGVLGAAGIATLYISAKAEEQYLIQQFGDDYRNYLQKVPRMNIILGIIRLTRSRTVKGQAI